MFRTIVHNNPIHSKEPETRIADLAGRAGRDAEKALRGKGVTDAHLGSDSPPSNPGPSIYKVS